jgi:hypothetical protein
MVAVKTSLKSWKYTERVYALSQTSAWKVRLTAISWQELSAFAIKVGILNSVMEENQLISRLIGNYMMG